MMPYNGEGSEKASSLDRPDVMKRSINHRLRESPTRRSPSSSPDSRRDHHQRRRSRSPRRHGYPNDHRDHRRYRDRHADYARGRSDDRLDHGSSTRPRAELQQGQKRGDYFKEHEHGGRDKKRRHENRTAAHDSRNRQDHQSAGSRGVPTSRSKDETKPDLQSLTLYASAHEKDEGDTQTRDFAYANKPVPDLTNDAFLNAANGENSFAPHNNTSIEEVAPPPMSTEERRKRREAIRAKYRDGAVAPTAVENLKLDGAADTPSPVASTDADTPGFADTQSTQHTLSTANTNGSQVNSFASSPADSPAVGLDPGSPDDFKLEKDIDNQKSAMDPQAPNATDEPNAAEYNPAADMAEDRERQKLKLLGHTATDSIEPNHGQGNSQNGVAFEAEPKDSLVAPKRKRDKDDLFDFDGEDDEDEDVEIKVNPENVVARDLTKGGVDMWDDPRGYLMFQIGELFDKHYKIISELGKGTFSSVFDAIDTRNGTRAAIKVMRTGDAFFKAGSQEVKYLKMLKQHDPDDKYHAIRYLDSFTHRSSHYCIAFECLKQDLRTSLKKNGFNAGLHISAVRFYASQIFRALILFRKCGIVHADLKPDNILVDGTDKRIKVCDMGSAERLPITETKTYLASRFYRAPEIILGMPLDYAIDMWAIGCTLFEIFTGKILFAGESNNQMLKAMMECRGKIPVKMMKKSEYAEEYFEPKTLLFISRQRDPLTQNLVGRKLPMNKITRPLRNRVMAAAQTEKGNGKVLHPTEAKELDNFVDLLERALQLNPEKRITPEEALKHPFIYRPTIVPTKPATQSRPLHRPIGASAQH